MNKRNSSNQKIYLNNTCDSGCYSLDATKESATSKISNPCAVKVSICTNSKFYLFFFLQVNTLIGNEYVLLYHSN